jgi:hypothetical protein
MYFETKHVIPYDKMCFEMIIIINYLLEFIKIKNSQILKYKSGSLWIRFRKETFILYIFKINLELLSQTIPS